ncbi:MAG TPA: histidine kinase dimerization/phospho-acceptor domain-containing protein [Sphingomonas sp.]|nr:histidine kinase dimerization/phospho-acceptor domain-containing protein [Sphingomonas sp.]
MRFDDTLETVLAADVSTAFGKASAWRQLVDLIGRRRIPDDMRALALLESIRGDVPLAVRITSARSLEMAEPPAALVKLCVVDEIAVAAPILRTARLNTGEWIELLPRLSSPARGVLRGRRDLPVGVDSALEGFRAADFVLGAEVAVSEAAPVEVPAVAESADDAIEAAPVIVPVSPFVPVGVAALGIPVVAAALREAADAGAPQKAAALHGDLVKTQRPDGAQVPAAEAPGEPFAIADVVARIDAFYTRQQDLPAPPRAPARSDGFRFETDAQGVIRWVDGVSRAPLIGLSLDMTAMPDGSRVDGVAAGALRQRARFAGARLFVAGDSDAGGDWRISASAAFDPASGRFIGYRGTGRRPRSDETAAPLDAARSGGGADSLRQLMHELRTPTNAIAGFSELIEREILGEAAPVYRERAALIRDRARALLAAIDDLDIAARIDAAALRLYPGEVALQPLFDRVSDELAPLAVMRGADVALPADELAVAGDARAIERLLSRTLATLLSAAGEGERIGVRLTAENETVAIGFDRPRTLAAYPGDAIFAIDDEREEAALLGTGFALRLIRNLARELSGSLVIEADSLTIRLPAAVTKSLEQVR